MRRLAGAREHLDGSLADAGVLAGNLRDLRRINRLFGGLALSRRAIDALIRHANLADDSPVALLDVGTGAADIPIGLLEDFHRRGRPMTVLAVDNREEVLAVARETANLAGSPELVLRRADVRTLPFEDGSFDFAHASLVLHHLEPTDAAVAIREMARVARHGVVMNDLARGWLPWLGAWLLLHLATRNEFTRHDGPLSVRRAYSVGEARQMLAGAGLRIVHQETAFFGHRWAIAAAPP
jgi:ubiquinone/menaquinone biosynthesis C-methylase UbiE